jgi:hypothetical protein
MCYFLQSYAWNKKSEEIKALLRWEKGPWFSEMLPDASEKVLESLQFRGSRLGEFKI